MRSSVLSKKTVMFALIGGAVALGATAAYAAAPQAKQQQVEQTPKGWSYELQNGQRVPKANRVSNPDGSWREELKQGNCLTVKEKSAAGEYKESRQCNPS
jgi:hypothetical protein